MSSPATRSAVANHALSALLIVAIALVANAIVTRHADVEVDLTADRENTLAAGTLQTIRALPDRARIRAFFTKDLPPEAAPYLEPARDVLDRIERESGGRVAVEYFDPAEARVAEDVKKLGITPTVIQVKRHDRVESAEIFFGLEVRCGDRPPKTIRFLDLQNPEYELARALKAVGDDKQPTIAFLTRESPAPPKMPGVEMPMSPDRIFEAFRDALRDRYRVVDLYDTKFGNPIPLDVQVLVLARPKDLDERERFEIDQFLMRGGRLLVLLERHAYDFRQFEHQAIEAGLDPLLEKWGVSIPKDVLVIDGSGTLIQGQIHGPGGRVMNGRVNYCYAPSLQAQAGSFSMKHPVTKSIENLFLFWVSPIDLQPNRPVVAEDLLLSSERAYRTKELDAVQPDDETIKRAAAKIVTEKPARERFAVSLVGKFPSAFAGKPIPALAQSRPATLGAPPILDENRRVLEESPETRVIVVGDSDLARNELVRSNPGAAIFLGNAIDWLVLDQALISIRSRGQTRMLRDLELEAQKELGPDPEKPRAVSSIAELRNLQDEMERTSREARDRADRKRSLVKLANMFGPGLLLIGFGVVRFAKRNRDRRRAADAEAGKAA